MDSGFRFQRFASALRLVGRSPKKPEGFIDQFQCPYTQIYPFAVFFQWPDTHFLPFTGLTQYPDFQAYFPTRHSQCPEIQKAFANGLAGRSSFLAAGGGVFTYTVLAAHPSVIITENARNMTTINTLMNFMNLLLFQSYIDLTRLDEKAAVFV
jgi:hypothetical protein